MKNLATHRLWTTAQCRRFRILWVYLIINCLELMFDRENFLALILGAQFQRDVMRKHSIGCCSRVCLAGKYRTWISVWGEHKAWWCFFALIFVSVPMHSSSTKMALNASKKCLIHPLWNNGFPLWFSSCSVHQFLLNWTSIMHVCCWTWHESERSTVDAGYSRGKYSTLQWLLRQLRYVSWQANDFLLACSTHSMLVCTSARFNLSQ